MRGRLAGVASEEDDAFLEGMLRVAHEQELWGSLLPIVRDMERQAAGSPRCPRSAKGVLDAGC